MHKSGTCSEELFLDIVALRIRILSGAYIAISHTYIHGLVTVF